MAMEPDINSLARAFMERHGPRAEEEALERLKSVDRLAQSPIRAMWQRMVSTIQEQKRTDTKTSA